MISLHFRDFEASLNVHVKWIWKQLLMKTRIYTNDETSDLSRNKECSEPALLAPLCYYKNFFLSNFHGQEEPYDVLRGWKQWGRERNIWSAINKTSVFKLEWEL